MKIKIRDWGEALREPGASPFTLKVNQFLSMRNKMEAATKVVQVNLLALGVLVAMPLAGHAGVMFSTSGTASNVAAYGQAGISFQVTSTVEVTSLSFYGIDLGGADTPYVQLWNETSNTLLGTVNWLADEAKGGWNSKSLLSPVTLSPGVTYQVAGVAYWVPTYATLSSFTFDPVISNVVFHGGTGWGGWGALSAPVTATVSVPHAAVGLNSIPEPSTLSLAVLSFVGVVALRRRRH